MVALSLAMAAALWLRLSSKRRRFRAFINLTRSAGGADAILAMASSTDSALKGKTESTNSARRVIARVLNMIYYDIRNVSKTQAVCSRCVHLGAL